MLAHLRANLLLLALTLLIGAMLYPLAVLVVGQGLFPTSASGSLITTSDGTTVGSRLIAQDFQGALWFHPRPSAVDFNATASGGSNLSAANPKLRERAERIVKSRTGESPIPADAVTASGSGLDPHITLRNARGQRDRVAAAWAHRTGREVAEITPLIDEILSQAAFRPLAGTIGGEEIVNVLEVNLTLSQQLSVK